MTKNLTTGDPLRLILSFALPLFAGNLFQQAYNMADAAIVGLYLGSSSFAAVGASGSVQFFILGFCMGLCVGFSIPVSQRFGADDLGRMRCFIFTGTVTLVVFSLALAATCVILCTRILQLMKTPPDIFAEAWDYLCTIFAGMPFLIFYNFFSGNLRAAGDSKSPFCFLLVSITLNIILDLAFIVLFHWGVRGAALATVISQAVSGALCLIYILARVRVLVPQREERHWRVSDCATLLSMGIPMGLQFSITAIGSMVLQAANNSLGSLYVSAFSAAGKIKQLMMSPFDAIGAAVSTFAAQNFGAQKSDRIRRGIAQGLLAAMAYGVVACLVLIFAGQSLCLMFVKAQQKEILEAAGLYSRVSGFFFWLIAILNVVRPTVQSLGFTKRTIFSGVVEMFARCFVTFVFVPRFAFLAVCFADPAAWLCAVLYMSFTLLWCLRKIERDMSGTHTLHSTGS